MWATSEERSVVLLMNPSLKERIMNENALNEMRHTKISKKDGRTFHYQ